MSAKKRKKAAKKAARKLTKKVHNSRERLLHHYKKIRNIYERELAYSAKNPEGRHALSDEEIEQTRDCLAQAKESIETLESQLRAAEV